MSLAAGISVTSRSRVNWRCSRAQQHGRHQRFGQAAALVGHRHAHAGLALDRARLPEDHLEHGAVDRVVLAVEGACGRCGSSARSGRPGPRAAGGGSGSRRGRWTTASNEAWRLMPSDRQSVATSRRLSSSPSVSTRLALLRRQQAGHDLDVMLLESVGERCTHGLGGGDVAAEDDRREAAFEQVAEDCLEERELGIARGLAASASACAISAARRGSSIAAPGSRSSSATSSSSSVRAAMSSASWSSTSSAARVRSARAAAAGLEPTQRISAACPRRRGGDAAHPPEPPPPRHSSRAHRRKKRSKSPDRR